MLSGLDTHNTVKYHSWPNSYTSSLFERVPVCAACNAVISVKHILIECSDLLEIRKKYFEVISLYSLFRDVCL